MPINTLDKACQLTKTKNESPPVILGKIAVEKQMRSLLGSTRKQMNLERKTKAETIKKCKLQTPGERYQTAERVRQRWRMNGSSLIIK